LVVFTASVAPNILFEFVVDDEKSSEASRLFLFSTASRNSDPRTTEGAHDVVVEDDDDDYDGAPKHLLRHFKAKKSRPE
jgi:hypothetical protein